MLCLIQSSVSTVQNLKIFRIMQPRHFTAYNFHTWCTWWAKSMPNFSFNSASYCKLEMHSIERGICPTAPLTLHLTLYSLTRSRVWPLGSRDVIGHMTTGTTVGCFLLVIRWHHVPISHGSWDITRHNLNNNIPIVNSLETNFGE